MSSLDKVDATLKSGDENLSHEGRQLPHNLMDFGSEAFQIF